MVHLQLRELLQMMHTCRTLYDLGIPLILRDITYLSGSSALDKLYVHLLSDPRRFGHIRSITCSHGKQVLPVHNVDTTLVDFSLELIRLGSNIRRLDLCFLIPSQFTQHDITQIASLTCLRVLALRGRPPIAQLLKALTVPLKAVTIEAMYFGIYDGTDNAAIGLGDLMPALEKFGTSLESLTVQLQNLPDTPYIFSARCNFPAMKEVHWRAPHPLNVGELAKVFPNVIGLVVRSYFTDEVKFPSHALPPMSPVQIDDLRHQNRNATQWDEKHFLRYLSGDTMSLLTLGVRCYVENLEVDFLRHPRRIISLCCLLADVQPSCLKVKMLCANSMNSASPETFVCRSVRVLELELGTTASTVMNALTWMVCVAVLFVINHTYAPLKVAFLRCDDWKQLRSANDCHIQYLCIKFATLLYPGLPEAEWRQQFDFFNWDRAAALFFKAIPSLKQVTIDVPKRTWRHTDLILQDPSLSRELFLTRKDEPKPSVQRAVNPPFATRLVNNFRRMWPRGSM